MNISEMCDSFLYGRINRANIRDFVIANTTYAVGYNDVCLLLYAYRILEVKGDCYSQDIYLLYVHDHFEIGALNNAKWKTSKRMNRACKGGFLIKGRYDYILGHKFTITSKGRDVLSRYLTFTTEYENRFWDRLRGVRGTSADLELAKEFREKMKEEGSTFWWREDEDVVLDKLRRVAAAEIRTREAKERKWERKKLRSKEKVKKNRRDYRASLARKKKLNHELEVKDRWDRELGRGKYKNIG